MLSGCTYVFGLSLRDVELLLAERGVVVSDETIRRWCKKFGRSWNERLVALRGLEDELAQLDTSRRRDWVLPIVNA